LRPSRHVILPAVMSTHRERAGSCVPRPNEMANLDNGFAATQARISFRKTLALLGGRLCKTPEEYKAWSQNLGHDHVLTTFSSYGDVGSYRQAEIIRAFSERGEPPRQVT
jgi:hypothetical protein